MTRTIRTEPLTAAAFAPFGEVLEAEGTPDRIINRGLCGRWHDRARLDFHEAGLGVSPREVAVVMRSRQPRSVAGRSESSGGF